MERLFDAAGVTGPPLSKDLREAFLNCVYPLFRLMPSLGDRIRAEDPILLRLTEEQTRAIELIDRIPRATLSGAAGTGKTIVAMELARRNASGGTAS